MPLAVPFSCGRAPSDISSKKLSGSLIDENALPARRRHGPNAGPSALHGDKRARCRNIVATKTPRDPGKSAGPVGAAILCRVSTRIEPCAAVSGPTPRDRTLPHGHSHSHSAMNLNMDLVRNAMDDMVTRVKPKNDTEKRVYEALSGDNWGASSTTLNEIAQDTFD